MEIEDVKKYDVIIVGAGPAGCACALTLKDANLKVALFDKKSFPRDKVCGDAIPGPAIKTLKAISPAFTDQFKDFQNKCKTTKTRVIYEKQFIDFNWVADAYTCARFEFDNFLYSLVKDNTATDIFLESGISDVSINDSKVSITDKSTAIRYEAKIVIGADGAQSVLAKQLAQRSIDRDHHVGSVRAYYSNIKEVESSTVEIYFDRKFLPSYLWIFPLPNNTANVGFGMLSSTIAKKKINLRNTFYDFIQQNPVLSSKFKGAEQISDLEGFGLPLGSRRVKISGDRFMLTGDAASLIDPITGDGIGNAMLSGKLAAEQVMKSFKTNDFSASQLVDYDKQLFNHIGTEFKVRYKAQRLISNIPFILDLLFLATKNKVLKKMIQKNF